MHFLTVVTIFLLLPIAPGQLPTFFDSSLARHIFVISRSFILAFFALSSPFPSWARPFVCDGRRPGLSRELFARIIFLVFRWSKVYCCGCGQGDRQLHCAFEMGSSGCECERAGAAPPSLVLTYLHLLQMQSHRSSSRHQNDHPKVHHFFFPSHPAAPISVYIGHQYKLGCSCRGI